MARPSRRAPAPRDASPAPAAAWVVVPATALWILAFGTVAIARVGFPYELEWIEGAMLSAVRRVAAGQPLYAAPGLDYVALNYTPLYVWVSAAVGAAVGVDFPALRLVSLVSALGVLVLLAALVRRATGSAAAGLVAAGLFCATYRLSGAWLDIARADSLYLLLLLAGAFLVGGRPGAGRALAAGALWGLAFLAKQSAPVVIAPLLAWRLARRPRAGLATGLAFAAVAGLAWLGLDAASGGWFRFYAFTVAASHAPEAGLALSFPGRYLVRLIPALIAFAAVAWLARSRRPPELGFHLAWFAGLLLSSWHLGSYRGGYDNVTIPVCLGAATLGGLAWGWSAGATGPARGALPAVAALLVLQSALLSWDPRRQVPSDADRRAGDRLVEALTRVGRPVLVASHPELLRRAGGPGRAHLMPLMDVVKGNSGETGRALWSAMRDSLRGGAWPVLVLDTRDWLLEEAVAAGYRPVARAVQDPDALWPVTGMRTRPEWILARSPADAGAVPVR